MKLNRKTFRPFILIALAAVLLGVFLWQNVKLTGAYVAKTPNAAILLQIVEGQDGKLEGQYQGLYLNNDGSLKSGAFPITGVADGWNISLSLKEMGFFPVAESSGRFNGMDLTLHFSGDKGAVETQKFSRSNVEDFQDRANQLRQKSQTILAEKAEKERQFRTRAQRQDFLAAINKLIPKCKIWDCISMLR